MLMRVIPRFSTTDTLGVLRRTDAFRDVGDLALVELCEGARRIDLRAGHSLRPAGQPANSVEIVISGLLKRTSFSLAGSERVVELLGRDALIGLAEAFARQPGWTELVAVDPCVLLSIDAAAVRRAVTAEPLLALRLLESLAHRQAEVESELVVRDSGSAVQRVIAYLVRLSGLRSLPATGVTRVELPARKQLIAARVGLTPESLSRVLRQLVDTGLAVIDGRTLSLDNEALATLRQV